MQMRHVWKGLPLAAALMLALSPVAHARDMKFGYVDLKGAMQSTVAYQKGMQGLETLKAKYEKQLSAMQDKISAKEKALLSQSMAMSPDVLEEKQQELKDLRKDYSRKQEDAQEALMTRKNRLDQSQLSDFYDVLQTYGKQNHFDFIFLKGSAVYANPGLDITSDIIKLLNKKK